MSEPRRLLDDGGSDLERSILRAGRADAPSPGSRRKALAALGLAGGATVTAASSSATAALAKSAGTVALLKWIGVGLVGGLLTIGVVTLQSSPRGDPPPAPRPAVPPVTLGGTPRPPVAAVAAPRSPDPSPSGEEAVTVGDPPRAPPPLVAPPPEPPPRASGRPAATSLMEEVAALDAAREALAAGDAPRALRALDDHDRRFAGGALGPETTVLRIDALVLRGDRATAARLGEAFLAAHPHSLYASRVRSRIGAPAPATP